MRKPRDLVLLGQRVAYCTYDRGGKKSVRLNTGMDRSFLFGKPTSDRIGKWMIRAGAWVGRG